MDGEVSGLSSVDSSPASKNVGEASSIAAESLQQWRSTGGDKRAGKEKPASADALSLSGNAKSSKDVKSPDKAESLEKKSDSKDLKKDEKTAEKDSKIEEKEQKKDDLEAEKSSDLENEKQDDFELEYDDESEVEDKKQKQLMERLEKLEQHFQKAADVTKESEYRKQLEADMRRVKEPFKFSLSPDELPSLVSDKALEFFAADPIAASHHAELVSSMMNKFMESLNSYQESQKRVSEFEQMQKRNESLKVVNELKERGVDAKVFQSKQFRAFESDPKNQSLFEKFEKRFGFGSVEYAHHAYDAFNDFMSKQRSERAKSANQEFQNARDKVSAASRKEAETRISGSPVVEPSGPVQKSAAELLREYRQKRQGK